MSSYSGNSSSYYSTSESSSGEDASNENSKSYKPGGYAPVSVGEVLDNRFRIIRKLGFGQFSIVYMAYDYTSQKFYALKINKSDKWCTMAANDEIEILNKLNNSSCTSLVSHFKYTSMFGEHIVLVFNIYGETLYRILRDNNYAGLPSNVVKSISVDILHALKHLNERGIINTDIKPENILIKNPNKKINHLISKYKCPPITEGIKILDRHPLTMSDSQKSKYNKLKRNGVKLPQADDDVSDEDEEGYISRIQHTVLSDFGNACTVDNHHSSKICTRQYKPPENILSTDYDTSADIWSFGCVVYEMLTGSVLFRPEIYEKGDKKELDDSHLASILEITGGDVTIYKDGKYFGDFAREDGSLRFINHLRRTSLSTKIKMNSNLSNKEAKEWANFILYMLEFDYKKRPTAKDILNKYEEWIKLIL